MPCSLAPPGGCPEIPISLDLTSVLGPILTLFVGLLAATIAGIAASAWHAAHHEAAAGLPSPHPA